MVKVIFKSGLLDIFGKQEHVEEEMDTKYKFIF